ncbi:MAG: dihydroorotase [Candidatus Micrarchaeota archaeon]|nr:dihydroorotase [Candidatus Micrarchaeota archaeon]
MIVIKGSRVVTHDSIIAADIVIGDDGKIATMGRGMRAARSERVEAEGLFALPAAIDSHVHFRDPEDVSKEDFSTGSASALCGGVAAIMDMPNYRNPPTTTVSAYRQKLQIASSKSRCDFLLRFGASEHNQQEAAESGAPQLKVFLTDTKSELSCSKQAAISHFRAFPREKPVCVHAEEQSRIEERQKHYRAHEKIRDKLVARYASEFVLEQARKLNRRVHLCHLTTALEIEMCRQLPNVTYEINPAHLFLSISDLKRLGFLGKVNPPLRDRREQALLWRCIGEDTIIATDHAPHLISHKLEGAPGFPGVGTMLPLMLNAVRQRRLTLEQVARICSYNPARAFRIFSKGEISAGADADIVLVDMKKRWKITAENRLSKCGWTPFEGWEVRGSIEKVFLRGTLAYEGDGKGGGEVLAKPGFGREMKPRQ